MKHPINLSKSLALGMARAMALAMALAMVLSAATAQSDKPHSTVHGQQDNRPDPANAR